MLGTTYTIQIGDYTMRILNYNNRQIIVDSISFDFETTSTGVVLHVKGNYNSININSLHELREYINRVKLTYLKAKEFEKQLNIMGDFA